MIHVIATITLKPGQREAFLVEFRRLMPSVHAEAGCIEYAPAIDVDSGISMQSPLRENVAVIIEKWASLDALKAHLHAPHMADYRVRIRDMVEGVTLQILTPA
jgi:quinol monooxygenase YgiN